MLSVEPDTIIFQRDTDDEVILGAAHRAESSRPAGLLSLADAAIPDGTLFEELFTQQRIHVEKSTLSIPAMDQGVQVWVSSKL